MTACGADLRWQCTKCGRWIPDSAIRTDDYPDPMAYYGISSVWSTTCTRCGVHDLPPRLVEVTRRGATSPRTAIPHWTPEGAPGGADAGPVEGPGRHPHTGMEVS